jgi:hypothetical protein
VRLGSFAAPAATGTRVAHEATKAAGTMANYERLSGLDECFLGFETANSPMHVAVTAIFEPGPLCRPGVGVDIDGGRDHLAGRHLPLFERQGIGIALLSYVGRLAVCIAADWNLGELLHDLAGRLETRLAELAGLAGLADEDERRRRARRAPTPRVALRRAR